MIIRYTKNIMAAVLAVCMCMLVNGCSVLPEENNTEANNNTSSAISSSENKSILDYVENTIDSNSETLDVDELQRITRYQVDVFLSRTPTLHEQAWAKDEMERQQPIQQYSEDAVAQGLAAAEKAMDEFVSDFATDRFSSNAEQRTIKLLYGGDGSGVLNGGTTPQKNGGNTEYWRIADCEYYNQFFFAPSIGGDSNMVKILFRCNLFAYRLKEGASVTTSVLTSENADIIEYDDAFLVLTIRNVSEENLALVDAAPYDIAENLLAYPTYEKAVAGFHDVPAGLESLQIPSNCEDGVLVDGYVGKPYVTMPAIVGQYIDISRPNSVDTLEALGIRYKVTWVKNDGTMTPYSILSTSVAPGTVIDITDSDAPAVEVTVAKDIA